MDIKEAERKVASILSELEKSTDAIVRGLLIEDIDVTRLGDNAQQLRRSVRIHVDPKPGTNWET